MDFIFLSKKSPFAGKFVSVFRVLLKMSIISGNFNDEKHNFKLETHILCKYVCSLFYPAIVTILRAPVYS